MRVKMDRGITMPRPNGKGGTITYAAGREYVVADDTLPALIEGERPPGFDVANPPADNVTAAEPEPVAEYEAPAEEPEPKE